MKIFSENKKALFDYNVQEKFEAGMVLLGTEVKSIKNGRVNLTGSYVVIRGGEPYIVGAKIPPYQPKNAPQDYNPDRARKLLLNKKEINYLTGKSQERGLTLIPLKIYTNNGKVKITFGVAKGKKKYDKRETIKKRDIQREIRGSFKE